MVPFHLQNYQLSPTPTTYGRRVEWSSHDFCRILCRLGEKSVYLHNYDNFFRWQRAHRAALAVINPWQTELNFEHLPVENMVYVNQQEYYDAISASTADGQCGLFIDFMLNEILKALKKNIKEAVPKKIPEKVPNKSESAILRLLSDNPHLTRAELAKSIGISENGVKKSIVNMKEAGWIERKGSNKSGYWLVHYFINHLLSNRL